MRAYWPLLLTLAVLAVAQPAHAERRIALVIGNSGYKTVQPLANPKNDAELMVASLKAVGFEVMAVTDADVRTMGLALRDFGKALRGAGRDAVGLFYFAGHGIQASGANYLLPVNARIEDEADLRIDAFSASDVLAQMESAGAAVNLVILDACRNNPFKGRFRSGGRGLARIDAASGSLIAFAAAPGQVAADGKSRHSPYTLALADAMREPGLTVEQVFKKVRITVEAETGGAQTPWEESSLRGDFHFTVSVTPDKVTVTSSPAPAAAAASDKEALFWSTVKDSGSAALLQSYIDQFPEGVFAGLAKVMIGQIEQKAKLEAEQTAKPPAPAPRPRPETVSADAAEPDQVAALPARAHPFDGVWTVNRMTPHCPIGNGVFPVTIKDGKVSWPVGKGTVGKDGSFRAEARKGRGIARLTGKLEGNEGSGEFRGTRKGLPGTCIGRFTMARQEQ